MPNFTRRRNFIRWSKRPSCNRERFTTHKAGGKTAIHHNPQILYSTARVHLEGTLPTTSKTIPIHTIKLKPLLTPTKRLYLLRNQTYSQFHLTLIRFKRLKLDIEDKALEWKGADIILLHRTSLLLLHLFLVRLHGHKGIKV